MKKLIYVASLVLLHFPLAYGQSGSIPLSGKSEIRNIPDHIRKSKPFMRAEWFNNQRAFPYDNFPEAVFARARDLEIQKIKDNDLKSAGPLTWSPLGPRGFIYRPQLTTWGQVSGRVRAISVHPNDPLTVYIGAASGGIWKTSDGGLNWSDIGRDLVSLNFGAIAIDPNNPEVVYAGSGECIYLTETIFFPGKGIFKTSDGGKSWTQLTNGIGTVTFFSDLAVSPHNSSLLIGALASGGSYSGDSLPNEGIWKSEDAGLTWIRTLDVRDAFDILFHPVDPNVVYAAIGGGNTFSGFYISRDQGGTWEKSNSGLQPAESIDRIQIDIARSNPDILYAVTYEMYSTFHLGYNPDSTRAYKSVNGGISWTQLSGGTNLGGYDGVGWYDQGYYDLCLAVDPSDPDHVHIGNVELHQTINGSDFAPVRTAGTYIHASLVHNDYHQLVYAPSNPNYLYIGCDGGIFKSTDKGLTASSINQGLETLQFYRIASHPANPKIIIGGMQDNGSVITRDGGSTWNSLLGGDGMECFFDPKNPDTVLYVSSWCGELYKSTDQGATFKKIFFVNGAWTTPFFMHPSNDSILYTANRSIYKSTNAAGTFKPIANLAASELINTLAQSQVDPMVMIFAAGATQHWPEPGSKVTVKVSTNEGVKWTNITDNIPGEIRWVSRVATDPVDVNTMYILRTGLSPGNKVWKTTDLGQTWTNISGDLPDLPCSDLFIDPENTQNLFVANDIGVYLSTNGGTNWNYASQGMPFVPVMDFDYVKIGSVRYLRAGTHGRSIYETQLPNSCLSGGIEFSHQADIDNFPSRFPFCSEIGEGVTITGNDITNLNGLSTITSVGGRLSIVNNPNLASLAGLNKIIPGTITSLTISGNTSLSSCELKSICDYLASPIGTVDIQNNATGCNSADEVKVKCATAGSDVIPIIQAFNIFPNPSPGIFTFTLTLTNQTHVNFDIVNNLGQTMATILDEALTPGLHQLTWNAEGFPAGVYYCRIKADHGMSIKKIAILR